MYLLKKYCSEKQILTKHSFDLKIDNNFYLIMSANCNTKLWNINNKT